MRGGRLRGASVRTRGLSVWSGLTVIAVVTAILLAPPVVASPAAAAPGASVVGASTRATAVDAAQCADVLFIGVRGSGERADEYEGFGPKVSLMLSGFTEALDPTLTYRSMALDYPSLPIAQSEGFDGSLVDDLISYGVGLPPSPTRKYADSIQQGTFALLDAVVASNRDCPDERIVLAGYSQGALVIHRVLSETTLGNKLAAVVLLADPARDTIHGNPQSGTFFGNAGDSLGIWLEPISGVVGLLSAAFGPVFGGTTLYFASRPSTSGYQLWDAAAAESNPHMALDPAVAAKTIEMCAATDLVCDTQLGFGGDWYWAAIGTHTDYGTDDAAAGFRAADVENLGALAAKRIPRSEWQYTVDHAGHATISGTTSTSKDLRIPGTVGGYRVTSIAEYALDRIGLTSVVIPETVTTIGDGAFYGNALTGAVIPRGVTTIGEWAFGHNRLASLSIPSSVTTIAGAAFYGNALTSVVIPGSVTTIGDHGWWGAFADNGLTEVVISPGVTTIGDRAFEGNALTDVAIPASATRIGARAFGGNELTTAVVPGTVTTIGDGAFEGNALTSVALGEGIETIGANAFYGNALAHVVIPASVGTIGSSAFASNTLSSAVLRSGVSTIGTSAFATNSLTSVVIPDSVTTMGASAFYGNALTSVVISAGLTVIADTAFYGNALTSVVIPSTVTTIENSAFAANRLTGVVIPDSVATIGSGAFSSNRLTSLALPGSVISIGQGAFSSNALTSVVIPEAVTELGNQAFASNALASVTIPGGITTIGRNAFGSNALKSVTISEGVERIGVGAFEQNTLTSVVIPASVTTIEGTAFYGNPLVGVIMLGDAPAIIGAGERGWTDEGADAVPYLSSFGDGVGLTITYPAVASGYATPTWKGYTAHPAGALALTSATPTISGTPVVGQKLTAKAGSWTNGATLNYQWYAGGSVIGGATASTLTLTAAQKDQPITVVVTGSKPGYATASRSSAATSKVATTGIPSISGSVASGSTITAKRGTWTAGMTFTYQWFANGVAIAGRPSRRSRWGLRTRRSRLPSR